MRKALFTLLLIACSPAILAQDAEGPRYTADGSLLLPAHYREWMFVSAGLGMTYGPQAAANTPEHPAFENVFVTRPAYQTFLKTGKWPAKTMFVLEIRSSDSKGSINKGGHYQTAIAAVEAEVKEGDKWTFYGFGRAGTEAKPLPRSESCYTCHAQNSAADNTFVQFYPTLLPVAKEKGTLSSTFKGTDPGK